MPYSLEKVPDAVLMRDLAALVAQDRRTTARLLAHLAEVDNRRLYLQAGFPTMRDYCIRKLRFSEEVAYKRIQVARVGRRFPVLFACIEDGRLHPTAIRLLGPHLRPGNLKSLITDATNRSCVEIEKLIATRYPQAEPLRLDEGIAALGSGSLDLSPVKTPNFDPEPSKAAVPTSHAPAGPIPPSIPTRVAPIAPRRFSLQVTISQETHDKLREVQDLLSHVVQQGDVESVLDRAFDALKEKLLKRKIGGTRCAPKATARTRHIPASVRRAVWERDGGRCTFVSDDGQRCEATRLIEFDHVLPVAKGGRSTPDNLRLRCRGHNQLAAEQAFGKAFVEAKRRA